MKAILIAGGNVSDYDKLYINENDYVICADSGYDRAKKLGIIPDVVIGDMDSVKSTEIKSEKIVYPTRKDYTDSELIMEYAKNNGFDELILLGFIGTRMDHTITNLSLLLNYSESDAVIINENNEIRLARDKNIIKGKKGDIVSIIPFGGDLRGIFTHNLEYTLKNENLYLGFGRGVSNVMTSDECTITIESGKGLIIKSRD